MEYQAPAIDCIKIIGCIKVHDTAAILCQNAHHTSKFSRG
uniref:Uncharacterized protein n=1 Tax=Anguilla anguilla TaxID=7936 RepID=A0A0E9RG96_ANGAN